MKLLGSIDFEGRTNRIESYLEKTIRQADIPILFSVDNENSDISISLLRSTVGPANSTRNLQEILFPRKKTFRNSYNFFLDKMTSK